MAKNNYNFWTFVQDLTAAVLAVPTYGTSLLISPTARKLVSGGNNEDNNANQTLESWKIQNQQWEAQVKANQTEIKRLSDEIEKKDKQIKKNEFEADQQRAIVNNPNSTEEEKSNARKRLILIEDENKKLKEEKRKYGKEREEKSKTPPAPPKPFSLPEIGATTKVIVAGSVLLLVYLVFIKEDKNK